MKTAHNQRKLSTFWRVGFVLCGLVTLLASASVYYLSTNRHVVVPGEIYRSAQLNPTRMQAYVQANHIATIINLRGPNPGLGWYRDERALAERLQVRHADIRLSKRSIPSAKQLRQIVTVLETAPKPLLIHCQSGSDRTGFVAAVALLLRGQSLAQARQQISLYYLSGLSNTIGPMTLARYQHWLHTHHLHSSRQHFIAWVDALGSEVSA